MDKKMLATGILAVLGVSGGMATQAAMLQTNDLLSITAGYPTRYDSNGSAIGIGGGSYFLWDHTGSGRVQDAGKFGINPGTDGGIRIGTVQPPGAIDDESMFFYGSTITQHYTTVPVAGGTTAGLDFSGWNLHWWGYVNTPMNTGAWTPTNCAAAGVPCTGYGNGVALFAWSGVYDDTYTLDYTATVPLNDISGFGGMRYFLHLEGVVMSAVPVPAAAWLLGSGLLSLLGVGWRASHT